MAKSKVSKDAGSKKVTFGVKKSGKLKKSVKIVRFDSRHFVIESNLPYSRFHNARNSHENSR